MNKLREYKGVTYRDGAWWFEEMAYSEAVRVLADMDSTRHRITDADHAALMDLKANPFEPTPYLESLLDTLIREVAPRKGDVEVAFYVKEFAATLRAAFPQIDADHVGDANKMVPPLTAADHIAALVAMGATRVQRANVYASNGPLVGEVRYKADALILPPEMTP